ncbi:hypothetical protein LJR098_000221 [Rhizobium sp. LjRoot98]|uniref:hypothetical protein n=1 Tax=unclassified Rhizobium TaxID=2613769 RepID=UPI0007158CDE|nr:MULTISPECIES: hypothetical protein [unclassified Rhizobium]KQV37166.1 hypothetical protein ASC96_03580 [Rhizobium sp. Root1204]KQY17178.1 hypothetical protein ASD36_00490 [Rhizobium sp. Root1334]KRC13073.1 hypothetical protein ASE23_00485 [Rhizobium sp. Root73]
MKHESQNAFRFRRVKWGDPRHAMNALRNKEPVFIEEEPASNRLFWTLVVLLVIAVFVSIVIFGSHRNLPFWN